MATVKLFHGAMFVALFGVFVGDCVGNLDGACDLVGDCDGDGDLVGDCVRNVVGDCDGDGDFDCDCDADDVMLISYAE